MISDNFAVQSQNNLLKAFINKFTSDEFFVDLINLTLYPADFGTTYSNKTIDYIKTFLSDAQKIMKINKFNNQQTLNNVQLSNSLLNIRESRSNILSYNNVFQHVNLQDLSLTKLNNIKDNIIWNKTFAGGYASIIPIGKNAINAKPKKNQKLNPNFIFIYQKVVWKYLLFVLPV